MCEENTTSVAANREHIEKLIECRCDGKEQLGTSKLYDTFNIPHRFECPYLFQGYGVQKPNQNIFYKTTSSDYGWYTPNPHSVPHRFFPRSQEFTNGLVKSGMYRNYSLNTVVDKSYY